MVFKTLLRGAACLFFGLLFTSKTNAQTPTDGLFMEKGRICTALTGGYESWNKYWEGELLRDNANLGTVSYRTVVPMFSLGLTDKINLIAGLPWMSNRASAGQMAPEKGFQDFSASLKVKAFSKKLGTGRLDLIANLGVSTPASGYRADYLPICLGLGAKTASARGILFYKLDRGLYLRGTAAYTGRSNIKIDRTFYFTDKAYYTNEVEMYDLFDWGGSVGFVNKTIHADLGISAMNTLGGTDIRRQDMPFPNYNMDAMRATASMQYWFKKPKGLGLMANAGYTLSGRNVGQSLSFGGGLTYQFRLFGKAATN